MLHHYNLHVPYPGIAAHRTFDMAHPSARDPAGHTQRWRACSRARADARRAASGAAATFDTCIDAGRWLAVDAGAALPRGSTAN